MYQNFGRFNSTDGKRQVLVVEDEQINREILGMMLENDFHLLYAENGREGLELIRANANTLSAVLLDLNMPVMTGYELLEVLKADPELQRIPVVVLTGEESAEVTALRMGAADFITKPFSMPEVVMARITRAIELSEDRYVIATTEQDEMTDLYRREFFYHYCEQFELHNPGRPMDAMILNIDHFHMINELRGRDFGDEVIRLIGRHLKRMAAEDGAIAGRLEGDCFLLLYPHTDRPEDVLEELNRTLLALDDRGRVRMRMGVYPADDAGVDVPSRFDRAKTAADTVRGSYTRSCAVYDDRLHQRELLNESLIDQMDEALRERQFVVYYQPKYAVQGGEPRLNSAEALIRWQHPTMGLVSPGVFIPLFEENGLIRKLDRFVWEEAAAQIRRWRDELGYTLPVSVNVSRVDMYDPDLAETFRSIVEKNGLTPDALMPEVTESAYTEDSEQIIRAVEELRALGFRIEMDDFGSGYSSLNMLSVLPIDALKLDMSFIRNMCRGEKSIRMLELMMDIARYLDVPVIAEGVEEESQVQALKAMGCDVIQGYYFSRPVPADQFETFIKEELSKC